MAKKIIVLSVLALCLASCSTSYEEEIEETLVTRTEEPSVEYDYIDFDSEYVTKCLMDDDGYYIIYPSGNEQSIIYVTAETWQKIYYATEVSGERLVCYLVSVNGENVYSLK